MVITLFGADNRYWPFTLTYRLVRYWYLYTELPTLVPSSLERWTRDGTPSVGQGGYSRFVQLDEVWTGFYQQIDQNWPSVDRQTTSYPLTDLPLLATNVVFPVDRFVGLARGTDLR